jgi:hypothetical protein
LLVEEGKTFAPRIQDYGYCFINQMNKKNQNPLCFLDIHIAVDRARRLHPTFDSIDQVAKHAPRIQIKFKQQMSPAG